MKDEGRQDTAKKTPKTRAALLEKKTLKKIAFQAGFIQQKTAIKMKRRKAKEKANVPQTPRTGEESTG